MPLSGLDPSVLLGFVARDEAEWMYLRRRVKEVRGLLPLLFGACTESHSQLPRAIFAMADEPPAWPGADDDDMGLESIFNPKEVEEEIGMDDGDVSGALRAPSSNASHGVLPSSHVAASTFSHTHQPHNSNSTTHPASTSSSGARSEEVDAAGDPGLGVGRGRGRPARRGSGSGWLRCRRGRRE
jgi:cysteine protease ATG4